MPWLIPRLHQLNMSKYKDDQGRFLTRALFFETSGIAGTRTKYPPPFTLKEQDYKNYKSLRQIYLSYEDPTEYSFAIDVFGSWDHWDKLQNSDWFIPHLEEWRLELETKMESKGIQRMVELAEKDDKGPAAKWLASKGWKEGTKRGRPSKEEVKGERKRQAKVYKDITEDADRIGLVRVK